MFNDIIRGSLELGTLWHDVRYTVRALAKTPAFCVTAVLTLALGIGANTAIFSAVNAIVLRPLPYLDSDRLVVLWQKRPGGGKNSVSGRNFLAWQKHSRSFSGVAALTGGVVNVTGSNDREQVVGGRVTANLFPLLGVTPALGRNFTPAEDQPGAPRVVILSHRLWQRRFAADRDILGTPLNLDGEQFTVLGVMPPNFQILYPGMELWVPLALNTSAPPGAHNMAVFARLNPNTSLEQAQREMDGIAKLLATEFPQTNKGWGVIASLLHTETTGAVRPALFLLLGAVGLVLLISCANVANLLLSRAVARHKEMAIRFALGADRSRIVRQLLTESLLLAFTGGAAGLLVAKAALRMLPIFSAGTLPNVGEIGIDSRVLGFTFVISVITGILFGLIPAGQILAADLHSSLKEGGRSSAGSTSGRKYRSALVIAEISLSLVLLIGAVLLLESFRRLQTIDRGFQPDHLLTLQLSIPASRYPGLAQIAAFYQEILRRTEALPGVEGVGATTSLPLDGMRSIGMNFNVEGRPAESASERPTATCRLISTNYFRAMGIPILQGRAFNERDNADAPVTVIVSQSLAQRFWPNENCVGRRLVVASPGGRGKGEVPREVVGVARDIKYPTQSAEAAIEIYLPFLQNTWPTLTLAIRTRTDPMGLASAVRNEIRAIDKEQPVSGMLTMADQLSKVNGRARWNTLLLGIFAAVALALAAVGIYGVISYSTSQRSQEIGVRMALGAQSGDILALILRETMLLAGIGILFGVIGYLSVSRLLSGLIYGVSPTDPAMVAVACITLSIVAALASYLPARRAIRLDPLIALRNQ